MGFCLLLSVSLLFCSFVIVFNTFASPPFPPPPNPLNPSPPLQEVQFASRLLLLLFLLIFARRSPADFTNNQKQQQSTSNSSFPTNRKRLNPTVLAGIFSASIP